MFNESAVHMALFAVGVAPLVCIVLEDIIILADDFSSVKLSSESKKSNFMSPLSSCNKIILIKQQFKLI